MKQQKTTMESFNENNPWICKFPLPRFKREKEREGYKGWISELKNDRCWTVQSLGESLGPAVLRFSLSAVECPRHSVLEMLHTRGNSESCCFSWYLSTDFLFSVAAYTDTQHAQFLKLSSSKRNANTNFVEAPPRAHTGFF